MGNGDGTGARSNAGNARRNIGVTGGLVSQLDTSRGHREVPIFRNGTNTTAETKETISTCRNMSKIYWSWVA